MNIKDLITLYEHHRHNDLGYPTVQLTKEIESLDTYFDEGMLADVRSIQHMTNNDTVVIDFIVSKYDDVNVPLEKPKKYYAKKDGKHQTTSEAGLKPLKYVRIYFYINDSEDYFSSESEPPVNILLTKEQKEFLIHAAKMEASIYTMRADEASTGNLADPDSVKSAKKDLELAESTIAVLEKS